jgi:hypothetical protein
MLGRRRARGEQVHDRLDHDARRQQAHRNGDNRVVRAPDVLMILWVAKRSPGDPTTGRPLIG